MDPFSLATGGGGLSGGSSGSDQTSSNRATFGGFGAASYNFGSGSISPGINWPLIAGVVVVGLIALRYIKK